MPGLQSDCTMAATASPIKKSRLSLKFFQKKETKRALDFSEMQEEYQKTAEFEGPEILKNDCDQVVPAPHQPSTLTCERRECLVPFVGLNNLGNTCYLNSILQVLYHCPGFKDGIKRLYTLLSKMKDNLKNNVVKNDQLEGAEPNLPVNMELLGSFHSLILSLEQLQSSFLLNPEKHSDGELATPPRRLLNILRQLNPMYEGYLQHDAQEVLQCILGYIQEACETIKKEHKSEEDFADQPRELREERAAGLENTTSEATSGTAESPPKDPGQEENLEGQEENLEGQANGKRKSDTEAGNAKKKSKPVKTKKSTEDSGHFTRSKRKSSSEISVERPIEDAEEEESKEEGKGNDTSKGPNKRKKHSRLSWLKPSRKQPSIFSKFCSMGRISSHVGGKGEAGGEEEKGNSLPCKTEDGAAEVGHSPTQPLQKPTEEKGKSKEEDAAHSFDMMERMFQGQLVLRTRCLECECYTERREDFQDISVPVQEDEPGTLNGSTEISPDPKLELKTLKWAISQFASVERIVGQDKYFCETCHHYAEAERSLLFDKTPEVVTIHLKCFAASSSEIEPYAGLFKVNTPLQTPLKLSLEEWGTRPSKEHYELFAVVMHSGITISSGHYTAFIKMMDLKEVPPPPQQRAEDAEEEARPYGPHQEYDDGEVSFSIGPKVQVAAPTAAGKVGSKKGSEGVGLLGGQRSVSSFELGAGKQTNPDKAASAPAEGVKSERTGSTGDDDGAVQKSGNLGGDAGEGCVGSEETGSNLALGSLLDYEGKWMLFDDSEVRFYDEKDFLNACSPETCTTSTPYLLFYKKVCQE
ncbi:hypothetical protein SKAU_G00068340 [Synaphobranchus kaupii]|uniref:Ubiquitin carboxyl-terminal hydrolase n=1 Tax=Synaphobranchus kaupii TaxID=118154 RepID=A0A9Q1G7F0_SYNKA|nr:hypothetical protein SKAU_G00068340 [Synaphobranchus kaupii]